MDEKNFIGREIGNYRIIAEINSGAYGSVYKAEHTHLAGRLVAIKFLHAYMGSAKEREQFAQEAQFLALLEHPHILPVIDFGFRNGQPYLIAGYAAGGSLHDLLHRQKLISINMVVPIITQVGQALHYAHQRNIIHRDLKPENILFNAQGNALLADFGIATMLSTASVKHLTTIGGTPPYMAPEQFQGTISKEGDQYALGCIAYELVTGHMPFTAPDFLSMGFKHLTQPPLAPTRYNANIPPAIEAAILKALAKQRSERHADIPAFVAALRGSSAPGTALAIIPAAPGIKPAGLPLTSAVPVPSTSVSPVRTKEERNVASIKHVSTIRHEEALIYHRKGVALERSKQYEQALAAFEQAIRLDPNTAPAYQGKGYALNELQRYNLAVSAFEQAIRLDPNAVLAHRGKGVALNELQRHEEAVVAFEQAIRLDPNAALAYRGKGMALNELRRYEEAVVAFEQAIRLDPSIALAHQGKGVALQQLGRKKEAQLAYKKARQLGA